MIARTQLSCVCCLLQHWLCQLASSMSSSSYTLNSCRICPLASLLCLQVHRAHGCAVHPTGEEELKGNSFRDPDVKTGMVLPFQQMTMTFHDIHYFVKCPPVCAPPVHLAATLPV